MRRAATGVLLVLAVGCSASRSVEHGSTPQSDSGKMETASTAPAPSAARARLLAIGGEPAPQWLFVDVGGKKEAVAGPGPASDCDVRTAGSGMAVAKACGSTLAVADSSLKFTELAAAPAPITSYVWSGDASMVCFLARDEQSLTVHVATPKDQQSRLVSSTAFPADNPDLALSVVACDAESIVFSFGGELGDPQGLAVLAIKTGKITKRIELTGDPNPFGARLERSSVYSLERQRNLIERIDIRTGRHTTLYTMTDKGFNPADKSVRSHISGQALGPDFIAWSEWSEPSHHSREFTMPMGGGTPERMRESEKYPFSVQSVSPNGVHVLMVDDCDRCNGSGGDIVQERYWFLYDLRAKSARQVFATKKDRESFFPIGWVAVGGA